jgi:hypothetical protein
VSAAEIEEPEQREIYLIIADYFSSMPDVCSHRADSSAPKFMFPLVIGRGVTYKPVIILERIVKRGP